MIFIYGKFKDQKKFKPIGKVKDSLQLVSKKKQALVWKDKERAQEAVDMLKEFNPDIKFKIVED